MINWTEIKNNHPKAWNLFINYISKGNPEDVCIMSNNSICINDGSFEDIYFMNDHELYGFFDSLNIYIQVWPLYTGEAVPFSYDIVYFKQCVFAKHSNGVKELLQDRNLAETAAFIKAFEILEKK